MFFKHSKYQCYYGYREWLSDQMDVDKNRKLHDLYSWIDGIPLSRPKKNIARDFSDGVLMAGIIKYFSPRLIDINAFPSCNSTNAKKSNWNLLNSKVFRKFNFELSPEIIQDIVSAKPGAVEKVLLLLRREICMARGGGSGDDYDSYAPEVDQADNLNIKMRQKELKPFGFDLLTYNSNALMRKFKQQNSPETRTTHVDLNAILWDDYEANEQQCEALKEKLLLAEAHSKLLENILQLKEHRIEELENTLKFMRRELM